MTPNQLVEDNINLVYWFARRITPYPMEYEDLVGYGLLGLVEASQRFDPTRGLTFTSFAGYRIRGAMLDAKRNATPGARRTLPGDTPKVISLEVFLSGSDLRPNDIEDESLEQPNLDDGKIWEALSILSTRQRRVIEMHYLEGKSLIQIAHLLQTSGTWVYYCHRKALKKLRQKVVA